MEFAIQWIKVTCILGIWVEISVPYNWNYPEKTFDQFWLTGQCYCKECTETVKNTVTVGFLLIDKKEFVNVMCGGQNN